MRIINTNLLRHPLNWLTIWSMVFIMCYVGHLLIAFVEGRHPGAPAGSNISDGAAGPGTDDSRIYPAA